MVIKLTIDFNYYRFKVGLKLTGYSKLLNCCLYLWLFSTIILTGISFKVRLVVVIYVVCACIKCWCQLYILNIV